MRLVEEVGVGKRYGKRWGSEVDKILILSYNRYTLYHYYKQVHRQVAGSICSYYNTDQHQLNQRNLFLLLLLNSLPDPLICDAGMNDNGISLAN